MFMAENAATTQKRTVTVEEYKHMRRQLFDMRCRYAALVSMLRRGVGTVEDADEAERLEMQIAELEHDVAHAEPLDDGEEPITLRELYDRAKTFWTHAWH